MIVKTYSARTATLGDPAHVVATAIGTVAEGAHLMFEAHQRDRDTAACTVEELAVTSAVIESDGPGEYRSDEVIFDRVAVC